MNAGGVRATAEALFREARLLGKVDDRDFDARIMLYARGGPKAGVTADIEQAPRLGRENMLQRFGECIR